jgi:hypothetical protein
MYICYDYWLSFSCQIYNDNDNGKILINLNLKLETTYYTLLESLLYYIITYII